MERSRKIEILEPEIDCASITSNSSEISTNALQNIRQQMSQSLCRMRDLEEQVKIIPMLQLQLSILKEEKRLLKTELEQKAHKISPAFKTQRINSVSLKSLNSHLQPQKCDVAVMCSILTRDVGIATNLIKTRAIAIQSDDILVEKKQTSTIGTQMNLKLIEKKIISTQTPEILKKTVGVNFSIKKNDFSAVFRPETRTIGISDDTVTDIPSTATISLKQMDSKRSLSFSLGENEKLNLKKNQTTQYNYSIDKKTIGTQSKVNSLNKSSQKIIETQSQTTTTCGLLKLIDSSINTNKILLNDAGVNTEQITVKTDTKSSNTEILPIKKDVSCGDEQKSPHILIQCADNYCDTCKEHIKNLAKLFSFSSSGNCVEQTNLSRIPRPTTAIKNDKKLVRQDTYTINGGTDICQDLPVIRFVCCFFFIIYSSYPYGLTFVPLFFHKWKNPKLPKKKPKNAPGPKIAIPATGYNSTQIIDYSQHACAYHHNREQKKSNQRTS